MDLHNIQVQLNAEFSKSDTRIIFWFDDKGEYEDEVAELQLDNAKLHILDGMNWFYSKWLLNESDIDSKYLVYAPFPNQVMQRIHWQICIITRFRTTRTEYPRCHRNLVLIISLKSIYHSTVIFGKIKIGLNNFKRTRHRPLQCGNH